MPLPFQMRSHAPTPADQAAALAFPASSRYHGIHTLSYDPGGGQAPVAYLARRFCPPDSAVQLLALARVAPGERLDQLTARTLGDPTQFWRVADANHALDPVSLATPGRTLRIPVPRGPVQT